MNAWRHAQSLSVVAEVESIGLVLPKQTPFICNISPFFGTFRGPGDRQLIYVLKFNFKEVSIICCPHVIAKIGCIKMMNIVLEHEIRARVTNVFQYVQELYDHISSYMLLV